MTIIGYYDDSAAFGGTVRYLIDLLAGLDRRAFQPVVFSPRPAPWHDQVGALDVPVVTGPDVAPVAAPMTPPSPTVPLRPPPAPRSGMFRRWRQAVARRAGRTAETRAIASLLARQPCDLLHSNNTGNEAAPLAARAAGIRHCVGTLHVDPTYDLQGRYTSRTDYAFMRRSLEALDTAIAVSNDTARAWQTRLDLTATVPHMVTIPNGIDPSRFVRRIGVEEAKARLGVAGEAFVLASVGRLDWVKGYADLLDAMAILAPEFPAVRLLHAGDGPLRAALAARTDELGLTDRVHWLGSLADVRDLLEAADLYVQPSWCETQGLAVLEAGVLGVPVVVSNAGGLPETVDHGRCGWLAEARSPAALAATLREACMAGDARAAHAVAMAARVHRDYHRDRMVHDTMLVYRSLLGAAA